MSKAVTLLHQRQWDCRGSIGLNSPNGKLLSARRDRAERTPSTTAFSHRDHERRLRRQQWRSDGGYSTTVVTGGNPSNPHAFVYSDTGGMVDLNSAGVVGNLGNWTSRRVCD